MTVFQNPDEHKSEISALEDSIYEDYIKIFRSYESRFAEHGCTIEYRRFRYNYIRDEVSDDRLPFEKGYQCSVCFTVLRDGKPVEYDEGILTSSESYSYITKKHFFPAFWKSFLQIHIVTDVSDVSEELERFLPLL